MILAITLDIFKTWLFDIISTVIICTIVFLIAKHFFKGEVSKIITSVILSGALYYIVKNPENVLKAISEIFSKFIQ